jgi:hypothetical protein
MTPLSATTSSQDQTEAELDGPTLTPMGGGFRWMAQPPRESRLRVAVIGKSKDDALDRYRESLTAWSELLRQ